MSQPYCTLMNIVLVSRLLFLHRDEPLTVRRTVGMAAVQIAGLFFFQFGLVWLALSVLFLMVNWIAYDYERRSGNHDLARVLVLVTLAIVGSAFFSNVLDLRFGVRIMNFLHHAGNYSSVMGSVSASSWLVVNVVLFGTLLVISEANCVVRFVFNVLRIAPSAEGAPSGDHAVDGDEYRAGRAIGILERVLIYFLVLKGQYAAIGIVLVAKGFTRFKELDQRRFAEYVLIGTLLSTLLALLVGEFIRFLLR